MYTGNSISEREKKEKYEGRKDGFDYIGTKDVLFNQKIVYDNGIKIPYENNFKRAYDKTILLCIEGGSAGRKIAILDKEVCFGNKLCAFNANKIFYKFLFYYLQSNEFKKVFIENRTGIIGGVSIKKLKNIILPNPPLAEQKRIVAKIEELLPYVEQYEKAYNELQELDKRFPGDLQKSILQLAIQGRLVPQRVEEGNAEELYEQIQAEKKKLIKEKKIKKEKPLPEITDDEKPFDIPETWKWVRLGEILSVIGGISYKKNDVTKNGIRILRGGNIQDSKIKKFDDDVFLPQTYYEDDKNVKIGDILIVASTGSKTVIGKAGYVNCQMQNTMIGAFLRICRPYFNYLSNYLRYLFESSYYRKHIRDKSQGTNINNIKESYITELLFPLPPLAEQKRIVAKIEELLPLCEKLKN